MRLLRITLLLVYLCGGVFTWTMPERSAPQQPHHFDVLLVAKMTHGSLEQSLNHLTTLSNMINGMRDGGVFIPVDNESQYQQLGALWRYFFLQQTYKLNTTLEAVKYRFNYLMTSPPLRLRNNYISKLGRFDCHKNIGIEKNLLKNLNLLIAFLGSNWRVPDTPTLISSFNGEAVQIFHRIIANRSLTARQIEDIKNTQQQIAFRKGRDGKNSNTNILK